MELKLLLLFSALLVCLSDSKTHPDDIASLKSLKNSIHPSSIRAGSCLSTWDFDVDPCDSLFSIRFTCGLRCDLMTTRTSTSTSTSLFSRVTEIALDSANYTGTLTHWTSTTATTLNLPFLQTLDLSGNSLAGPIPPFLFSKLTRLRRLSLSFNLFTHQIPNVNIISNLSSQLQQVSLDHNRLSGPIPSSFRHLTSLTRLNLQSNRLSGLIPDLSSLHSLTYLDISDNSALSFGPHSQFPARSLVSLLARNNSFQSLNPNPNLLQRLEVLDLSYNSIEGPLPVDIFFAHPSLQQLSLSHNRLSSIDININITNSNLVAVDLSNNAIAGNLPTFLAQIPTLSALSLENNQFSGMIPSEYALAVRAAADDDNNKSSTTTTTAASFSRLLLAGNYLFGPIPGPLLTLKLNPASSSVNVNVTLAGNCLYTCPQFYFFCRGSLQKPLAQCWRFLRPRVIH